MNAHAEIRPEPPANIDAEQAVLGAILLNNAVLQAMPFLRADHFDEAPHRAIFEAITARLAEGRPANVLTLAADLPPFSDPDLTAAAYLAHLAANAWTVSDQVVSTAREIVVLSARRRLSRLGADLTAHSVMPGARVAETIATAELDLMQLSEEIGQLTAAGKDTSPNAVLTEIGQRMTSGRHYKGVESGLVAIDNRLGGFAPGEVIVVAGRPGMGKTLLGLSLARRAAHTGVGVGFDSIEMTKAAVWHRLLADEALANEAIPYKNIGRGKLSAGQFETVSRASERLKELPLYIIDRGNRLSDLPSHIRSARRFLNRQGKELDLFVVDYLGILEPGDRYAGQRVNEVGEISSTIKALAKREGIAVIALHQLNRANETRGEDRRPRLSDLRDSGNLEQDADVVMFVYRDAYYIERPGYRNFADDGERIDLLAECASRMEVIVAKQRQGEIGTCRLWCNVATNSVRDEA